MFRNLAVASLLALAQLSAACQPPTSPAAAGKPRVVATFSILGDLVRNVGGDAIALSLLAKPGQDTHTFEPSPADGAALANASVVFENGLGFEAWLDDLYAASGSRARRVVASEGIEPLTGHAAHPESEAASGARRPGAFDPHVWHSAANAIQMTNSIRDALAEVDPAHAAMYRSNAATHIAQLQDLDAWVFAQVRTLPADRRKMVTTHDTFGYFAQRYGFTVIGSVLPTSTEGASPSAQQIAALVEAVKAAGVSAVFAENVSSNALLNQIASEAGVKLVASLYTDALGEPGSEGDTYLKMMRFNVATITTALSR